MATSLTGTIEGTSPDRAAMTEMLVPRRQREALVTVLQSEMQSPLLSLQAMLDALVDNEVSPSVTDSIRAHSRELGRRIALLAEDLATVATVDAEPPTLHCRDINLTEMLVECAGLFPDVVIHVVASPSLRVRADGLRLLQLFTNLVRNALRRGARPLAIQARAEEGFVTLRVLDAGPRDTHEMQVVELLVTAHGGRFSHEGVDGRLTMTLPRAASLPGVWE